MIDWEAPPHPHWWWGALQARNMQVFVSVQTLGQRLILWEALGQALTLWVPLQAAFGFRTWVKTVALQSVTYTLQTSVSPVHK